MKIKLKSTGEIVDVEKKGDYYIDKLSNVYREDEVDVQPTEDEIKEKLNKDLSKFLKRMANDIEEEKERLYWRDVRKEILIELIKLKYLFHDVGISDLVKEADLFVTFLKSKDR